MLLGTFPSFVNGVYGTASHRFCYWRAKHSQLQRAVRQQERRPSRTMHCIEIKPGALPAKYFKILSSPTCSLRVVQHLSMVDRLPRPLGLLKRSKGSYSKLSNLDKPYDPVVYFNEDVSFYYPCSFLQYAQWAVGHDKKLYTVAKPCHHSLMILFSVIVL